MNAAPALTTICYVGSLGRAIGHSKLELDVHSVAEAIRATNVITGGALERHLAGPARDKLYRIALQRPDNVIDPKAELHNRSGRSTIYIMPAIKGRNSGVGKVIAGIALIGFALTNPLGWASLAIAGTKVTVGALAIGFGTSMLLGGITQLLTPAAKGPAAADAEQRDSTSFQGNAAAVTQGGCVPVVYGRALVSPIPVSVTFENNDVSTTDAGTVGKVTTDPLQGGGQQYTSSNVE